MHTFHLFERLTHKSGSKFADGVVVVPDNLVRPPDLVDDLVGRTVYILESTICHFCFEVLFVRFHPAVIVLLQGLSGSGGCCHWSPNVGLEQEMIRGVAMRSDTKVEVSVHDVRRKASERSTTAGQSGSSVAGGEMGIAMVVVIIE